ncbi:HipA N-terminal domain-containing protein [Pedobacter sp. MC2016-24]|uniref:HipA N-terminal domain-containing protein n=1 Tax=Pedobacter sp. MC2016-24 TaxID=2780090 RepID=UPI00187F253F|nr:HipA N-terminal domain-containing protein [Pedobacter sp. MC2016-24]MBE9601347.1 HipA N-terminal domain-containing protein [Pedobacter sp. MC2016-24]
MRSGQVFLNNKLAGTLTEESRKMYVFRYEQGYFDDPAAVAVSLTLPKSKREYRSAYLFPFFFNMLAEGVNKELQSRQLRIDREDAFGLLLATTGSDTIGAVTVKPLKDDELTRNK